MAENQLDAGSTQKSNLLQQSQDHSPQNVQPHHLHQNSSDQWQSDLEAMERTKYQSYLIMHAIKYQTDKNNNNSNDHNVNKCTRSQCEMLSHMNNCDFFGDFQRERSNCGQQQQPTDTQNAQRNFDAADRSNGFVRFDSEVQASTVSSTKNWHNSITHELRRHLIDKIIQAVLPQSDRTTVFDDRVRILLAYAKKIEEEAYEKANSKPEYYYLLAYKIYELKNSWKEKRQKRKAEQLQCVQMAPTQNGTASATHNVIDLGIGQRSNDTNQQNGQLQQQVETKPIITKRSVIVTNRNKQNRSEKIAAKKISFSQTELENALLPTWKKMSAYKMTDGKVSRHFRQPVDPNAFNNPANSVVVRKPMDLSTIKTKLTTGQYSNPWEYIGDVWLMFENAWHSNKRTPSIYNCCTRLSKIFNKAIDAPMQSFGYCCGQKYKSNPLLLACNGKPLCTISRQEKYRCYSDSSNNTSNRYILCEKCFNGISGGTVTVESNQISKTDFTKMLNNQVEPDPFVDCCKCGRKQHQLCVLYHDSIWPNGFVCDRCLHNGEPTNRIENKCTAERLPQTQLSAHIEKQVKNFLDSQQVDAGKIHIRVVYSSDKFVNVHPELHVDEFPYRAKTILVFQEIDGIDVCFFGMCVQEYGSECAPPNTRRVYIAYLDSVHYFKPRQSRTAVYHEILLGYMSYAKQLGYTMAHIWASPPRKGEDYLFDCHPPDQKMPTTKRLQEWYKIMLEKGKADGIVVKYNNIVDQVKEDKLTSAADLPYFEGDHLPKLLEQKLEADKKKSQKKVKNSKSKPKPNDMPWCDTFAKTMDQLKNAFFAVRLHAAESIGSLPPIQDPDPHIESDLFDTRDKFLAFTEENHYEFSSLRHVQHSTLGMLYALHQERDLIDCDHCKKYIETRYHCIVCDDYDLCRMCKATVGHEHPMEKYGLDLDEEPLSTLEQTNPQKFIQQWIKSFLHAYHCQDKQCPQPRCLQLKQALIHMDNCEQKSNGTCRKCKPIVKLLFYHAKQCNDVNCKVPFCSKFKASIKQQKIVQRIKEEETLSRRVASMI